MHLEISQKFEKKSLSKYPPFFGFAPFFRMHFEKKYGISRNWKFRANIQKEIFIEIFSDLLHSFECIWKKIWRSRNWKFQKYPLLSISSIRKNEYLKISRKNSKRNLHRNILQFSHSFERISRKKIWRIGNFKNIPLFRFPPLERMNIWKFRAKIRKEISLEVSSDLLHSFETHFEEKEIWRSRDRKFGSRAPRFDLHTRDCGSAAVLWRHNWPEYRVHALVKAPLGVGSGVRAVTVNKRWARPCAPHRRGEIDRES